MHQFVGCSLSPGPLENFIISKNMEECKEGKVVANHVFPVWSVQILYARQVITALYSWHIHKKMLWQFCRGQGNMYYYVGQD
jgi:hypothetical protein